MGTSPNAAAVPATPVSASSSFFASLQRTTSRSSAHADKSPVPDQPPASGSASAQAQAPAQDRRLHDLYAKAKALFDLVSPQEYGFDQEAKEEIGVLTSLPLLRKVWGDLEEARTTGKSLACFYFT